MLDIDKKPEQQGYAALAIGTALQDVHFDFPYDFQLWLLQSDVTHPSELIVKTNNIKDKNYNENLNEFENKIDNDGKNDLTVKLNTGIGEDYSFDNDNHDIQNQINVSDDDKNKNNNGNDINNNNDKINDKSDKHYDDDNENDKFSLIPVTKNQTMSLKKNQNNSNVNNDDNSNKNENIQKSMTGIEKLVSLLYHSTNNESFIMQNGPYLDELQRNVLFAILSAARENGDVQENLCEVKKSDFSVINNGDINKDEISSVGGKMIIDQSVFMNYLIKIAERSNRNNSDNRNNDIDNDNNNNDNVSYELTRSIWNFINLILAEKAIYRRCFLYKYQKKEDLSEEEKEEWSNMVFTGDFFLTEQWFNLAGKAFEIFFHLYTVEIEKNPNWNFVFCDENGDLRQLQNTKNTVFTDLRQGALRSILYNVLMVEKEIIIGHEILKLKLKDEYKKSSNSFLMTLNAVINLEDSECGSLIYLSRSLLEILA